MKKLILFTILSVFMAANAFAIMTPPSPWIGLGDSASLSKGVTWSTEGTFTDADTDPSIKGSVNWVTANTGATTIDDFDDGIAGQTILIRVGDTDTTFDFTTSSLKGNGGSDYAAAQHDTLWFYTPDGATWYCTFIGKAAGGAGESNTASDVGAGGVAVFKQKTGVDLEFRSINAASAMISVALDAGNNEVDINIADAELVALAGLTSAANKLPYFTGSGTAAVVDMTAFAITILDDADAAAVLATIGAEATVTEGSLTDSVIVSADIKDDVILEADLKAVNAAVDEDLLGYEVTTGDFEWHSYAEVKAGMSLNNVENTAVSTWAGSANITTLGTIATGTWEGDAIGTTYAGTDLSAANLAAVLTFADGDLIDLSGITQSNDTNEGFILPTWANVTVVGLTSGAIAWDEATDTLKIKSDAGWQSIAPTGAPTDAEYVVLTVDATLTAERVLTAGTGMDLTDGGAGSTITVDFDSTEIGTTTWGAGAAITWTFDASAGTDMTQTYGDSLVTFSHAVTVTGVLTSSNDLALGAAPASTGGAVGDILMSNATAIYAEAAPASTDVHMIGVDASEVVQIAASGASGVTITPAVTFSGGITDAGTIAAGTWQGTAVADAYVADNITLTNITQITNRASTSLSDTADIAYLNQAETVASAWQFDAAITMAAQFNINANDIASTGDIDLVLGDAAGANYVNIKDSGLAIVWQIDSDGIVTAIAKNDPFWNLNEDTGTDVWGGIHDTGVDEYELRTSETVNTQVAWYTIIEAGATFGDFHLTGNMNVATGKVYRINGTQIDIADLGAGGNWTPTGTLDLDSSTLQNVGHGTVVAGDNYVTISNNAADDTIDELMAAIEAWAVGVSAGTLITLSDVVGANYAPAGVILIGDGVNSYDEQPVSGHATLSGSGVVAVVDFALTASADAGDFDITSVDKLEGVDAQVYIDLGANGIAEISADTSVNITTTADTDITMNFVGTTASGVLKWMEDEDYFQFSDAVLMDLTLTLTGDISVGDDVLLADGAVVGITGNEIITFNAAGSINVTGATMDVDGAFTATTIISDGVIGGYMEVTADADGHTVSATEVKGGLIVETGNQQTVTLPSVAAGMNICVHADGADGSAEVYVDCDGSDHFEYDGTTMANGEYIYNDSDEKGDRMCFIGMDADTWLVWYGGSTTVAEETP